MPRLIAGIFIALIISATGNKSELQTRTAMKNQKITLWQLIDVLGDYPSILPGKISQVLPVKFTEKENNGYFSFYDGGRLSVAGQIDIAAILLRVRNEDETRGMISLYLDTDDACVTLDDAHGQFPSVVITGTPRGHSLDEETYWSIQRPWGELSFGFKERKPDCLASLLIDRTAPPSTSKNHPQGNSHP